MTVSRNTRFAVHRLHLPDGAVLPLQVVEQLPDGTCRYFPLQQETAFTEWRGGDCYLSVGAGGRLVCI